MIIRDVISAMESKGIIVSIELGEHSNCDLESNCPIAIQLRKIINESGITFPELIDGIAKNTIKEEQKFLVPEEIKANLEIKIGETSFTVNFDQLAESALKQSLKEKMAVLNRERENLRTLAQAYNSSYNQELYRLRNQNYLLQTTFDIKEMIQEKCFITGDNNEYLFYFETEYSPEYLIHNGVRSRLSKKHIDLIRRKAYITFKVSKVGAIIKIELLDENFKKLRHYHGNESRDCWGTVDLSNNEKRVKLGDIIAIKRTAMGALKTINRDSLMSQSPSGMPDIKELAREAILMGKEGQVNEGVKNIEVRPVRTWGNGNNQEQGARNGWGAGRVQGPVIIPMEGIRQRPQDTGTVTEDLFLTHLRTIIERLERLHIPVTEDRIVTRMGRPVTPEEAIIIMAELERRRLR